MRTLRLSLIVLFLVSTVALGQTSRKTGFDPKVHGFKFGNSFKNNFVSALDIRTGGLCGGMSYSALDYYLAKKPVPPQDYAPAEHTDLRQYLYDRQVKSLLDNADKWGELVVNPFGSRTDEFFRWGLEGKPGGRIHELRACIDRGRPVPLGLFAPGGGGVSAPHHQVLAIGYDMGRYKGDLGAHQTDFKVFIYDPNYPGQTQVMVPDPKNKLYRYQGKAHVKYMTWFVDRKYRAQRPPSVSAAAYAKDGRAYELIIDFRTGKDDLRGGHDNLDLVIACDGVPSQTVRNVNRGERWIDDNTHSVSVPLNRPVAPGRILSLSLRTTSRGGLGRDNWNLDRLKVRAVGGNVDKVLYNKSGRPLHRFTGKQPRFTARIAQRSAARPVATATRNPGGGRPIRGRPAGAARNAKLINRLDLSIGTGGDDLRGGKDNLEVTLVLRDGRRQRFANVNRGRRFKDRSTNNLSLKLDPGVPLAAIKSVELRTLSGGGLGGDNWDLASLKVTAVGPGQKKVIFDRKAKRLHRFTGKKRVFRTHP